mmetsp:Transcript_45656/g.93245  ORF Transcript_45656/g.93245 Transcript_45656/m.93245 type:complete len:135 (+) Transcript_45656:741-1145(+)
MNNDDGNCIKLTHEQVKFVYTFHWNTIKHFSRYNDIRRVDSIKKISKVTECIISRINQARSAPCQGCACSSAPFKIPSKRCPTFGMQSMHFSFCVGRRWPSKSVAHEVLGSHRQNVLYVGSASLVGANMNYSMT